MCELCGPMMERATSEARSMEIEAARQAWYEALAEAGAANSKCAVLRAKYFELVGEADSSEQ